jgi:uncharacterized protein (DUF488 family)
MAPAAKKPIARVLTIGHSTRSLEMLVELLSANRVRLLVDVRTIPRSRRNPQFDRDTLPEALRPYDIAYGHMPGLGGLRRPRANSPNAGWRNASFRGYADHMQTPEFADAIDDLIALAKRKPLAVMCAEAVPWRCHRSLLADALVVRGLSVEHILGGKRTEPHALTAWAHRDGTRLTYPAAQGELAI